jgi:hypothetical protein
MASDEQQRWREISRSLDEALDLADDALEPWLRALDASSPDVSSAVRALLVERSRLGEQPLLNEEQIIPRPHGALAGQQLGAYTLESVLGSWRHGYGVARPSQRRSL